MAVDSRADHFGVLERLLGRRDNPREQKPEFTLDAENGPAVHMVPASGPGPRMTGFLEPPARVQPLPADIAIEWRLSDVSELRLRAPSSGIALVGPYIHGDCDFAARQGDW